MHRRRIAEIFMAGARTADKAVEVGADLVRSALSQIVALHAAGRDLCTRGAISRRNRRRKVWQFFLGGGSGWPAGLLSRTADNFAGHIAHVTEQGGPILRRPP